MLNKKNISRYLSNNNRFVPENTEYRKAYLLNIILIAFVIISAVFAALNFFTKDDKTIAIIELCCAGLGAVLIVFFHKTDNIKLTSYFTLLAMSAFFSVFIAHVKNQYYSIAWICITPPVAFFLLGNKQGRIFSAVYVTYFIAFLIIAGDVWSLSEYTNLSILNITGSVVSMVLLLSYYEQSRHIVTQSCIVKNNQLIKINEELIESQSRLRLILDSAAEAIYGIDLNGICTFCNKSCLKLLGYRKESDLLGKEMHSIVHYRENGEIVPKEECRIYKSMRSGKKTHGEEVMFVKADGTPLSVEYYSYPQRKNGKIIGAVVTFLDNTERKKNEEKIKYISTHDVLTGLYNRSGFMEKLSAADNAENLPATIMFCDLNGLKLTNDVFGHRAGDELIKKCAGILKKVCRPDDIIARTGGDEFVVYLPKTDDIMANETIKKIRRFMSNEYVYAIMCSMSIGSYTKTDASESVEKAMDKAEDNMYRDKTLNRKSNSLRMIETIMSFLHQKSGQERSHSLAVSLLCERIGKKMNLPQPEIKKLKDIGYYHDIGKIVLSDDILKKGITETEEERTKKRQHSVIGYRILNIFDFTLDLAEGVYSHHERWDGSGYPKGLKGEEIPIIARIIAIAEHYDKLTGNYTQSPLDKKQALEKIKSMSGEYFDPKITDLFIDMMENDYTE